MVSPPPAAAPPVVHPAEAKEIFALLGRDGGGGASVSGDACSQWFLSRLGAKVRMDPARDILVAGHEGDRAAEKDIVPVSYLPMNPVAANSYETHEEVRIGCPQSRYFLTSSHFLSAPPRPLDPSHQGELPLPRVPLRVRPRPEPIRRQRVQLPRGLLRRHRRPGRTQALPQGDVQAILRPRQRHPAHAKDLCLRDRLEPVLRQRLWGCTVSWLAGLRGQHRGPAVRSHLPLEDRQRGGRRSQQEDAD